MLFHYRANGLLFANENDKIIIGGKMECKRCGHALPKTGFVCTNCGMMMNVEQIKTQRENIKMENKMNTLLVSEKYGHKNFIYEKREEKPKKGKGILLFLGILLLIILLGILVYF